MDSSRLQSSSLPLNRQRSTPVYRLSAKSFAQVAHPRIALFLLVLLAFCGNAMAQSFEETWLEFLNNDKVSNISALAKPNKVHDKPNYIKYMLMNTNNAFCQSDMSQAEAMMDEIFTIEEEVHQSVPGFVSKRNLLQTRMKATYIIDSFWTQFLKGAAVAVDDLEAVEEGSRVCEKKTVAKLSYMVAYGSLCAAEMDKASKIFETRTLRLAEKTSLRISDVEGLEPRVAKMKAFFLGLPKLDAAWREYAETGVSPGFATELPLFPCYPVPKIKELVLRGVAQPCAEGPAALAQIEDLIAKTDDLPDREFRNAVNELRDLVGEQGAQLEALNRAWASFLPDNKVDPGLTYGYEYCSTEPLIRAHIMDGFSFVCALAELNLDKVDSLRRKNRIPLDKTTKDKIEELTVLRENYNRNGKEIEELWRSFVAQGDTLIESYDTNDLYCDHVQEVKDWTMRGLMGDCEETLFYLDKIETFNKTFEFKFYEDLECRIQKLRVKMWDCRYAVLAELAELEESDSSYEERLAALMLEYQMPERPELCQPGQ